jgi:predicted Zn finger-like uncharacterized protein
MRLVCPNCDAQYELDDGAIPESGRDVQCSNCGHAWFQRSPDLEAELEAEDALFGAAPGMQTPQPVSKPSAAADLSANQAWLDDQYDEDAAAAVPSGDKSAAAVQAPVAPKPAPQALSAKTHPPTLTPPPVWEPSETTVPPESPEVQAPIPVMPRRGLDESLLAVLREEAERETAVRRSETPRSLESQPELGLEETTGAASAAKAVRDRLARLRGQEAEPEITEKPTARRDLLPDIEEINSTLRASTENRSGDEVAVEQLETGKPASNSGFRSGFSLMLLLAVVLVATYLAAPRIAEHLPATKGAMESYVVAVDNGRIWLDGAMRSAISALQSLTGAPGG